MNQTSDEEFDILLRDRLAAAQTSRPIANLPGRAIAIAMSRQAVAKLTPVRYERSHRARVVTLATVFAILAIASVWLIGIWLVVANDVTFSSSSSAGDQPADLGFAVAILAGMALIVGWVARSFLDSIDNGAASPDLRRCFEGVRT